MGKIGKTDNENVILNIPLCIAALLIHSLYKIDLVKVKRVFIFMCDDKGLSFSIPQQHLRVYG